MVILVKNNFDYSLFYKFHDFIDGNIELSIVIHPRFHYIIFFNTFSIFQLYLKYFIINTYIKQV